MNGASDVGRESAAPRTGEWRVIAVLFLFYAIAYLDKRLVTMLLEPIRESFGATDLQMSVLTGGAFVIFYVLFSFPIGWATDRYPRRLIIFAGVLLWSLFAAAGGLARTYGQLLVTRCGVGAGEAVLGPAGNSLVADTVPRSRITLATAATHAGALGGSALAFALGGILLTIASGPESFRVPLLGEREPWQAVMLLTGAPGMLLAFLAFAMAEPGRERAPRRRQEQASSHELLGFMRGNARLYSAHFLGFGLMSMGTAAFAGWMPTHMIRTYGLSFAELGTTLALLQLTFGLVGMIAPAMVIDRLFSRGRTDAHLHLFAYAAIIMAFAGMLVGFAPSAGLAFCGIVVVDLMVGMLPAAGAAIMLTTPDAYRGQIMAIFLIIYNVVGQGLGPVAVATITDLGFRDIDKVGYSLGITLGVICPLAAVMLFLGREPMRQRIAEQADRG